MGGVVIADMDSRKVDRLQAVLVDGRVGIVENMGIQGLLVVTALYVDLGGGLEKYVVMKNSDIAVIQVLVEGSGHGMLYSVMDMLEMLVLMLKNLHVLSVVLLLQVLELLSDILAISVMVLGRC